MADTDLSKLTDAEARDFFRALDDTNEAGSFYVVAKREHSALFGDTRSGQTPMRGPAGKVYELPAGKRQRFLSDAGMQETFLYVDEATGRELLALQAEEREKMAREAAEAEAAKAAADAAEQERQERATALRDLVRQAVRNGA